MSEWRDLSDFDPPKEPAGAYDPPGAPAARASKFMLEPWSAISFEAREEWLVKRFLPRKGLAAIYGKPGSLKSFIATHLAVSVATGEPWGGRRVTRAPAVYIAAEGAAGLRKRRAAFVIARPSISIDMPLYLVSAAPNLGATPGDLGALIGSIEGAGAAPGLIVVDTLAATLGAADENGSGMTAFVANAGALASRFGCLVLIVHHTGLGDERRMRGHSSLHGALDAQILVEREDGALAATLTLQKLKDESSDLRLKARLSRVVLAYDEDGDEISTLIVDEIEDAEPKAPKPRAKPVPASLRLLMSVVAEAIDEAGETIRPGADMPIVKAVAERHIRSRYFARIAERADEGEDKERLFDRQRKGFKRSIEAALKTQLLAACDRREERFLWTI